MAKDALLRQFEREWQAAVAGAPPAQLSPGWQGALRPERLWRPAALFAELEDLRRQWQQLRESPLLVKLADRFVNPGWTFKDLLAHLLSWAVEFRQQVETAARGETFDYIIPYALSAFGPNEWNQAEVERRREMILEEVLEAFDDETRRLQDLVFAIPAATLRGERAFPMAPGGDAASVWRGSVAQVVGMKCMHDRYHLAQIRGRLEGLARIAR